MIQLPDWKDPEAYPKPGKVSNKHFAWEFLRRNSAYQSAWADYIRRLRQGIGGDPELSVLVDYLDATPDRRREIANAHFATADDWNRAYVRLDSLPVSTVTKECGEKRLTLPLEREMATPWALERLTSPWQAYSFERVRFAPFGPVSMPTSHGLAMLEAQGENGMPPRRWLTLNIDLEWPAEVIEQQVLQQIKWRRDARVERGEIQPIEGRARPDKWREYLRILDARAQGVHFVEIGNRLSPDEPDTYADGYKRTKRLKAAFEAACKLRDGEYRALPMMRSKIDKQTEVRQKPARKK